VRVDENWGCGGLRDVFAVSEATEFGVKGATNDREREGENLAMVARRG